MIVGDKVVHKDYPRIVGEIVMTRKNKYDSARVVFVCWAFDRNVSQHIESALRKVNA